MASNSQPPKVKSREANQMKARNLNPGGTRRTGSVAGNGDPTRSVPVRRTAAPKAGPKANTQPIRNAKKK